MLDFVRYTRRYSVMRDSWNEVFDFAVDTANMAKHEPEKFIKEWIINEIEEMMKGLRNYLSRPKEELETFLSIDTNSKTKRIDIDIEAYCNVIRFCTNKDIEEYKTMPNEKVMVFKAEKITGCLMLLDNLRKLSEIASVINPYIAEIEKMNLGILPEIETHIHNITLDLQELKIKLDILINKIEPLRIEQETHKKQITQMQISIYGIHTEGELIYYNQSEEKYKKTHPEYMSLMNKIELLTKEKIKIDMQIFRKENFLRVLNTCKTRIVKLVNVA